MTYVSFPRIFLKICNKQRHTGRSLQLDYNKYWGCLIHFETAPSLILRYRYRLLTQKSALHQPVRKHHTNV